MYTKTTIDSVCWSRKVSCSTIEKVHIHAGSCHFGPKKLPWGSRSFLFRHACIVNSTCRSNLTQTQAFSRACKLGPERRRNAAPACIENVHAHTVAGSFYGEGVQQ